MSYQGYFKNGRFITSNKQNIKIPENTEVVITFVDSTDSILKRQREAMKHFLKMAEEDNEELGAEFDEILSKRVNITRVLDL